LIQINSTTKKLSTKARNEGQRCPSDKRRFAVAFDLQLGNANLENQQRNGRREVSFSTADDS
jgi:hypothetical protein